MSAPTWQRLLRYGGMRCVFQAFTSCHSPAKSGTIGNCVMPSLLVLLPRLQASESAVSNLK